MTGIMKTEPLAANAEWAREVIERRKLRLFQSNVRREAEILILRQQIIRSAASKEVGPAAAQPSAWSPAPRTFEVARMRFTEAGWCNVSWKSRFDPMLA